jgi:hypothetical protein
MTAAIFAFRAAGVTLALSITAGAFAQCEDSTTTLWYETTAVRLDGNTVRLNGQTYITGDYWNWWYPEVDVSYYFNGTLEGNSGWYYSDSIGGTVDWGYTVTLQTYGPGRYSQSSVHDAYTPFCTYGSQNTFSAMCELYGGCAYPPPWTSSAYIDIVRPTVVGPGNSAQAAFWYLGGASSIDGYYVQTNLTGTTNSTAVTNYSWYQVETPPKVSITNTNNGATSSATVKSTGHSAPGPGYTYDMHAVFSIDGFTSAPFPLYINAPYGMTSIPSNFGRCSIFSVNGVPLPAPGWLVSYQHGIADLGGAKLVPIATAESLENDKYLPGFQSRPITGWRLFQAGPQVHGAPQGTAVTRPGIPTDCGSRTFTSSAAHCTTEWRELRRR